MSNELRAAIEVLAAKVEEAEAVVIRRKKTVNELCLDAGLPPRYADAELAPTASGVQSVRPDQFYGKSPTVAAREYIEARGEAVDAEEIVNALEQGGFDFDNQGWRPPNRVRNLSIAMSKNSQMFHRLPNGTYGLVKFYPEVEAEKKKRRDNDNGTASEASPDEADDENESKDEG